MTNLKDWTKPSLIALSDGSINSGDITGLTEYIMSCFNGVVITTTYSIDATSFVLTTGLANCS